LEKNGKREKREIEKTAGTGKREKKAVKREKREIFQINFVSEIFFCEAKTN
jgi:hypothetical protein